MTKTNKKTDTVQKYNIWIGKGWWDGSGVSYGPVDHSAARLTLDTAIELRNEWKRIDRLTPGPRNESVFIVQAVDLKKKRGR